MSLVAKMPQLYRGFNISTCLERLNFQRADALGTGLMFTVSQRAIRAKDFPFQDVQIYLTRRNPNVLRTRATALAS